MRFLILSFLLVSSILANGILRTDGTKIVDADGTEIIFRGIGIGGWLVPKDICSICQDLPTRRLKLKINYWISWEANAEIIYQEFRDAFFTEADLDSLVNGL